nr:MAG TPA: hypothetical protein [Caudoviricetes sp.]
MKLNLPLEICTLTSLQLESCVFCEIVIEKSLSVETVLPLASITEYSNVSMFTVFVPL